MYQSLGVRYATQQGVARHHQIEHHLPWDKLQTCLSNSHLSIQTPCLGGHEGQRVMFLLSPPPIWVFVALIYQQLCYSRKHKHQHTQGRRDLESFWSFVAFWQQMAQPQVIVIWPQNPTIERCPQKKGATGSSLVYAVLKKSQVFLTL